MEEECRIEMVIELAGDAARKSVEQKGRHCLLRVSSVESLVVDVVRLAADVDQGVVEELRNGDAVGNVSAVPTLVVARVEG